MELKSKSLRFDIRSNTYPDDEHLRNMELKSKSLRFDISSNTFPDDETVGSSGSLRLRRSDSLLRRLRSKSLQLLTVEHKVAGRSQSSRLFLESIPADCAAATIYERLSTDIGCMPQRDGVWRSLRRAFSGNGSHRRMGVKEASAARPEEGIAKAKKTRSSWLPDPDKRWPLQGW